MVDADSEVDVDTLDHAGLLSLGKRRISDRRVVTLRRQWLQEGGMEEGRGQATARGGPPGGVVSPLMAKRSWPGLDLDRTERYAALGNLTRYADECGIVCRPRAAAQRALEAVAQVVQQLQRTRPPPEDENRGAAV